MKLALSIIKPYRCVPGRTTWTQRDVLPGTHRFARLMRFSLDTYFNSSFVWFIRRNFIASQILSSKIISWILFAMLKGFLNHGSVIVHDLLLGTSTCIHFVSFPARRARSRRSAGHTTIWYKPDNHILLSFVKTTKLPGICLFQLTIPWFFFSSTAIFFFFHLWNPINITWPQKLFLDVVYSYTCLIFSY